ncbi:hypothetical protein ACFVMC_23720 [Nocardia sp. NPDC127579]|uniref:hypothetical protein n=1 Tax=Nocardia sp. NPDC127579 TaxID=3345402 RepID=UPI0036364B90
MTVAKKFAFGIVVCAALGASAAPAAADPIPLGPPPGMLALLPSALACLASTGSAQMCLG